MRAVAELNYHPNLHARTLAGGKSRTLGIIVSNMENPFFFDVFRAVEAEAQSHGYDVVIANTGYSAEQLARSVRLMIGRRVAGLAVVVSETAPDVIEELTASKIRTVFYDVGTASKTISNIRVNYRRGVEQIVEYLYMLGHRRIAFIGHHSTLGPINEREKSFVETVSRYADTAWRVATDQDGLEGGRMAARDLLQSDFKPTALICVNDFMAAGVLRTIREFGLHVPRDISVTGFDNIKLSEFCNPPLTTVHIPRDRVGEMIFRTLIPDSGAGRTPGRDIVIDPEFIVRESTGPVPKAP
jgi:DNA-binding LacI/PurR family transcriptional regulator